MLIFACSPAAAPRPARPSAPPRTGGDGSEPVRRPAARRLRCLALAALPLALAACGDGRLFDGTPYVGEITPTVQPPQGFEPATGEALADGAVAGDGDVTAGAAAPTVAVEALAPSEPPPSALPAAAASPVPAVPAAPPAAATPVETASASVPAPAVIPASTPPAAVPAPPPTASQGPDLPTPALSMPPASVPPSAAVAVAEAPPTASAVSDGTAGDIAAGEVVPAPAALETLERPAVDQEYPNLADVPPLPSDLSTAEERAARIQQLEAEREALRRGAEGVGAPGAVPPPPTPGDTAPGDAGPASAPAVPPAPVPAPSTPGATVPAAPPPVPAVPAPAVTEPVVAPPSPPPSDDAPAEAPAPVETAVPSAPGLPIAVAGAPSPAAEAGRLLATLSFSPGSAALSTANRTVLQRVVERESTPAGWRIVSFASGGIGGSLDRPSAGSATLARARATAVADALAALGVPFAAMVGEAVAATGGPEAERTEIRIDR